MKKTKIEYCDSTWNPISGCGHGCPYCYARSIANRFAAHESDRIHFGDKSDIPGLHILEERVQWHCADGKSRACAYPFGFEPTLYRYKLDEPSRWTKPKNIFVCSMADLFGEWVPDSWIDEVLDACAKAPQHRYLFLSKNPSRYSGYGIDKRENWWYGMSVTREADAERFGVMPAFCNRFASVEPLLEDLRPEDHEDFFQQTGWIIIGAETGNREDKVVPRKEWVDRICEMADKHHVPVFMKESILPVVGEGNMRRELPWNIVS